MKRVLGIFLGILTAIGGFVDMGDLVANAAVGARFGMNLAWVVVVGVVGIVVYAEMSGTGRRDLRPPGVRPRARASRPAVRRWPTSSPRSPSTC